MDYKKYFEEAIKNRKQISFSDIKMGEYYLVKTRFNNFYILIEYSKCQSIIFDNEDGISLLSRVSKDLSNFYVKCDFDDYIYNVTQEEIMWLNECIKQNKFIDLETVILTSFIQENNLI